MKPIKTWSDRSGESHEDEGDKKKKEYEISRWIGKTLRTIALFQKTKISRGETQFQVLFADLLKYMDLEGYLEKPDSDLTKNEEQQHHTPPTPPSPLSPPHNTIKVVLCGGEKGEGGEKVETGEPVEKLRSTEEKAQEWRDSDQCKKELSLSQLCKRFGFDKDGEVDKAKRFGLIQEVSPGRFRLP